MIEDDFLDFIKYYKSRDFKNAGQVLYEVMSIMFHSEKRVSPVYSMKFERLTERFYEKNIEFSNSEYFLSIVAHVYEELKDNPDFDMRSLTILN